MVAQRYSKVYAVAAQHYHLHGAISTTVRRVEERRRCEEGGVLLCNSSVPVMHLLLVAFSAALALEQDSTNDFLQRRAVMVRNRLLN